MSEGKEEKYNYGEEKSKQIEIRKQLVDSLADYSKIKDYSENDPRLITERNIIEKEIEHHIAQVRHEISMETDRTKFDDLEEWKQIAREKAKERIEELSTIIDMLGKFSGELVKEGDSNGDKLISTNLFRKYASELFSVQNKAHREKKILDAIANNKITPDNMEDEIGII